jgi:hypothetical protein
MESNHKKSRNQKLEPGIPPDDLCANQFVSIVKKKQKKQRFGPTITRNDNGELAFTFSECNCEKEAEPICEGVPHRVLAVSWPWAVLAIICPGGGEFGPRIVDVREHALFQLSDEYVSAITTFVGEETI